MSKFQRLMIAVSLAGLIVSSQRAFGQFEDLIGRVPDSANAEIYLTSKSRISKLLLIFRFVDIGALKLFRISSLERLESKRIGLICSNTSWR